MSLSLLVRAELIRFSNRKLYLVPIALSVFYVLLPILFWLLSLLNGPFYTPIYLAYSGFPDGLFSLMRSLLYIFPISIAIFCAGAISEDYSTGCLKVMLPRVGRREVLIAAKIVSLFTVAVGICVGTVALCGLTGLAVRLFSGNPIMQSDVVLGEFGNIFFFICLNSAFLVSLSVMICTVVRTPVLSMILTIMAPIVMRLATFLPGGVLWPGINLDVLELRLLPSAASRFSEEELVSVVGGSVQYSLSLTIILVSCAFFTAATVFAFRRDIQ